MTVVIFCEWNRQREFWCLLACLMNSLFTKIMCCTFQSWTINSSDHSNIIISFYVFFKCLFILILDSNQFQLSYFPILIYLRSTRSQQQKEKPYSLTLLAISESKTPITFQNQTNSEALPRNCFTSSTMTSVAVISCVTIKFNVQACVKKNIYI